MKRLKAKRGRWTLDAKTGEWREGSASPRLDPEYIRSMPTELTTTNIEEGDKVHVVDPPHIVESLQSEWENKQKDAPAIPPGRMETLLRLSARNDRKGDRLRLSEMGFEKRQLEIDIVRCRILFARVADMEVTFMEGGDADIFEVNYVWFPEDILGKYELRRGNPPHNDDRPKWLKNHELELDLMNLPSRGKDLLKEVGFTPWDENPAFVLEAQKLRFHQQIAQANEERRIP